MTAAYIHNDTSWESAARVSNMARDQAKATLNVPGSHSEIITMIDNVWHLIAQQLLCDYDRTINDPNCLAELGDALQP